MYKLVNTKKLEKKYEVTFLKDEKKYTFKISEDLLIEFKLFPVKEIEDEKFNEFTSKLPFDSALLEGMKYSLKKERSEKEVKDFLLKFTSSKTIINQVVETLKNKNLINDDRYFESLINYLIEYKKIGRFLIEQKLKEVGLDHRSYIYDSKILKENINEIALKYYSKLKDNIPVSEKINKTKYQLYQKGYSESDIENNLDLNNIYGFNKSN